ncbi:hypothetical protein CEJ83_21085, partial [Acinetobacter baumannii]
FLFCGGKLKLKEREREKRKKGEKKKKSKKQKNGSQAQPFHHSNPEISFLCSSSNGQPQISKVLHGFNSSF